ncbi:MAG: CBS domain-containing protein [Kordiimonadaceae bacterium]|jgi:CBS domain-containing protein|nr:CBS domain-containing protein [Kordiimonadaceae bacterium]
MSTQNNKVLVSDVMMSLEQFPVIGEKIIFKEALEKMGEIKIGVACIVDKKYNLLGILTDGDIRRKLLKVQKPFSAFFVDDALIHAIHSPMIILPDATLNSAVIIMGENKIWDLPVVDSHGVLVGLLHLHPAIKALLGE